jgi:hypothetical protein
MTRFVIDAATAVRLVREGVTVSGAHQLVAPNVLRSQALSIIYRSVRDGSTTGPDARLQLERITAMRIRLLGDRVSRGTAFRLALDNGWDDTADAEYIAVTQLQADALVTGSAALASAAQGIVELAPYEALLS